MHVHTYTLHIGTHTHCSHCTCAHTDACIHTIDLYSHTQAKDIICCNSYTEHELLSIISKLPRRIIIDILNPHFSHGDNYRLKYRD